MSKREQPLGVRKQQKPFIMSPTHICRNNKISSVAYKLWNVIESKPENWEFFWYEILSHFLEGRNKVKKSLKELEKFGFLKKTRRKKGNLYCGMDFELFYDPTLPLIQENQGSARLTENGSIENGAHENRPSENGETEIRSAENGDINKDIIQQDGVSKKELSNKNLLEKNNPPPPQEKRVLKFEGGVSRLESLLAGKPIEEAKKNAMGWDWWNLCEKYIEGINNGRRPMPDDIKKAFPAWVLKYTKGKRP